jgi:hypothetical protein
MGWARCPPHRRACPSEPAPMADLSAAGIFVAIALILLVVAARLEKL